MKCLIVYAVIFLFMLSCRGPKNTENYVVILITEKASEKDGLYLNLSGPGDNRSDVFRRSVKVFYGIQPKRPEIYSV